jgi:hypothetical protein
MTAYHLMKSFSGIPSPITPEHCVDFGRIGYVTYGNVLKKKYKPRAFKCYMVGYAMNHSPHTYKVFRHEPGKSGEIIVTRNVRWEHWDHPRKSKLTDSSPLFTKVEGLNKEQRALLEKGIDKFMINNKICPTEFTSIATNTKESTNSDLRRKVDDHQRQVRKSKPAQKGMTKKSTTKKPKEPAEIDEDGIILVTGKNAARRPQHQIQPQHAARGQPTTQYEVLSSDEESQSEEEDDNKKKAPKAKQPRLTRESRALGISKESDETSEEPRPSRSKMTRELRSLGTTPSAEESTTTTTSSNKEESPGAIHSAITSDSRVPTTFKEAFFGPMSHVWRPAIYEELLMSFISRKSFKK